MRFVLHYRGPLRANGRPDHKHELRKFFHRQLAVLWQQRPLSTSHLLSQPPKEGEFCSIRPAGGFTFAPLVTEQLHAVAGLEVSILRPEPPGRLFTHGGDIDNRLKTLFDSLTMPRHPEQIPPAGPATDETPFFCLLEDDNLIADVAVRTDQLLEPNVDPNSVEVTIRADLRHLGKAWGNIF